MVLCYSNENVSKKVFFKKKKKVCVGFVGWILNALLLLKIIVNMKRCYAGVLGYIQKCINFAGVFFKGG